MNRSLKNNELMFSMRICWVLVDYSGYTIVQVSWKSSAVVSVIVAVFKGLCVGRVASLTVGTVCVSGMAFLLLIAVPIRNKECWHIRALYLHISAKIIGTAVNPDEVTTSLLSKCHLQKTQQTLSGHSSGCWNSWTGGMDEDKASHLARYWTAVCLKFRVFTRWSFFQD